jgi:hypothetical protein
MKTRVFTRDELDAIGVPFECDPENGYAEELYDELFDTTRWSHVREFVFRAPDDGKAYRVYYWVGATEMQDQDVWNWDNKIAGAEVEQVQVTKTKWKPVKGEN